SRLERGIAAITDDEALAKYQAILAEYVREPGAKLVDADGDGALGPKYLVVIGTHSRTLGDDLAAHMKIGAASLEVAHEMADAGLRFGSIRFSGEFFESFRGSHRIFQLKPGMKPSDALDDILKKRSTGGSILEGAGANPYSFDCATADVIFDYRV